MRRRQARGCEEAGVEVVADGLLADIDDARLGDENVVDRLPLQDARGDELVELVEFGFGDIGALAGVREELTVDSVGRFGVIDVLAQRAARTIRAPVADVGRTVELGAALLLVIRATRVAKAAERALAQTVRLVLAQLDARAIAAVDAAIHPTSARPLRPWHAIAPDLPRNRLAGDLRLLCDVRK